MATPAPCTAPFSGSWPYGRDIHWETTIAEEYEHNIHVGHGISEDAFVKMREYRDKTLPKLIIPSLQVNMRASQLPPAEDDGKTYLKVPINGLSTSMD